MSRSSVRTLVFLCLIISAVAILVHAVNEEFGKPLPTPVAPVSQSHNDALIDINTADKETLMQLKGIGEAKAQRIIDFRTKNGLFVTTNDLMRVDGIGEELFRDIQNKITV